jgi:hypothetical protein
MVMALIDRAAWVQTFKGFGCNHALTLVYNDHRPTMVRMTDDLHNLMGRLDSANLGPRYTKAPAQRRTHGYACAEGIGTHPHLHVGLTIFDSGVDALSRILSENAWQTIAPAGSYKLTECDDGWLAYCTKDLTTSDHIILF